MAGTDTHLLELLSHRDALSPLGHDERRLATATQLRVDRGHDDVRVGDATIGDPGLRAVEDPLVGGLVVDRAGLQRRDIRASVWLRDAESGELEVVRGAEALRDPLHRLLRGAVGHDARDSQRGAHQGQADACVTPGELLQGDDHLETLRVGEGVGHEVHRVQANLGRLLDDGPRGLLALVPLVCSWPHHVLGEVVNPRLHGLLILVELHRELSHGHLRGVCPRRSASCG